MDVLGPLHPVADVLDLAGDAVAALGVVTVVAVSRWLLPAESLDAVVALDPARDRDGPPPAGTATTGDRRHPRWAVSTR
jgi:hypothetical protein